MDEMVEVWNAHHIRPTKNQNGPHGRPIVMYKLPSAYDTITYIEEVDEEKVEVCKSECIFRDQCICDKDVKELSDMMMEENGFETPTTVEKALELYCRLRNEFNNAL